MNLLKKPFPAQASRSEAARTAVLFGAFVALFLWFFKPFGLGSFGDSLPFVVAGYGAITTSVMLFMQLLVPRLLPRWYQEDSWTVGKEIAQTTANILFIALANLAYTAYLGEVSLSLTWFFSFLVFTLIVGGFPVAISVLVRQNSYHRRHLAGSLKINTQLANHAPVSVVKAAVPSTIGDIRLVELVDEYGKQALRLDPGELLALESADNYVKVYHHSGEGVKVTMVRSTISAVEDTLSGFPQFMRTHRSWMVNLLAVAHVEGNARGYILRLDGMKREIPVARGRLTQFDHSIATIAH